VEVAAASNIASTQRVVLSDIWLANSSSAPSIEPCATGVVALQGG